MIKIIKEGEKPLPIQAELNCDCGTLFSYNGEDIKHVEWFGLAIDCPICGKRNKAQKLLNYPEKINWR